MGLACNRPSRRFRRARGERGGPLGGAKLDEQPGKTTPMRPRTHLPTVVQSRPPAPSRHSSPACGSIGTSNKSNQLARRFCSAAPDTLLQQQQAPPIHKTTKANGLHQWMGFRAWWLLGGVAWCSRSCAKSAHVRCDALSRRMTPLRPPAAGLSQDHHEHPES